MSYPFRLRFDRRGRGGKEWAGGEGVGWVGKEWAGGEGVGWGERSGPGGKESAVADWLVVRYISLLTRFFIRFF